MTHAPDISVEEFKRLTERLDRMAAAPGPLDKLAAEVPRRADGQLPLKFFEDFTGNAVVEKRWLIKSIFARGETSAWVGPPGSMKSALMVSAAISVSSEAPWFGRKNKGAAGVVYFALERSDLNRRRFEAHRRRDVVERLPIALCSATLNMMDRATPAMVRNAILEAENRFGLPVGLAIFDTFAKMIAAGGGDENLAKDQGILFANLQRIKEYVDVHCALVGHTGKDQSRGARGSNTIVGDVDLMVMLSSNGHGMHMATVSKANDAPEGALFSFNSETFDFGLDEDGDPISVNIVAAEQVATVTGASMPTSKTNNTRLPKAAQTALRALQEALAERGTIAPASNHIPTGARIVSVDLWRDYAYRMGISTGEVRANQQAFKRAFEHLIGGQHVCVWDDQVWQT